MFCSVRCFITLIWLSILIEVQSASSQDISQFWNSITRIYNANNAKWSTVADQVAQINAELGADGSGCYQAIEEAFRRGITTEWSAKLIHSNSFIQGNLVANLVSEQFTTVGSFDECLSVRATKEDEQDWFEGKYCLATLTTPRLGYYTPREDIDKLTNHSTDYFTVLASKWLQIQNRFPLALGICVPSLCTTQQVNAFTHFLKYLQGIELNIDYCQQQNDETHKRHNFGSIFAMAILFVFASASVLCTIAYIYIKKRQVYSKYPIQSIAKCFHLGHNMKTLFRVSPRAEGTFQLDLRFIHGLKALLILSTVLGHVVCVIPNNYMSPISLFTHYPSFYFKLQHLFVYTFVERSALVIDFFFLISGFLVTHLTLSHLKKLPAFSFYVFIRWIRFVPSVIAIFCFTILFQKIGSGPLFHEKLTEPYVKPCYDYWWTHLLFIHNFWKIDQMCGPNLWFISVDFQLYILLYFVLALYLNKPRTSIVLSLVSMLLATFAFLPMVAFNITGVPRADYPIRFNYPQPLDSLRLIYTSPQFHIMPYVMGMFIAIYLSRSKNKKAIKSEHGDLRLLLCVGSILACILVQLPDHLQSDESSNSNFVYGLYFMFIYLANNVIGAVTFYQLVCTGKSWIKRLLCSQFLVPLSRLSLGIYLLNPLLIWFNVNQSQQTPNLTLFYSFQLFCSIYLQTILLSIVLFILFEAPFNNLSRLFGKQLLKHKPQPAKSDHQVELSSIPSSN